MPVLGFVDGIANVYEEVDLFLGDIVKRGIVPIELSRFEYLNPV